MSSDNGHLRDSWWNPVELEAALFHETASSEHEFPPRSGGALDGEYEHLGVLHLPFRFDVDDGVEDQRLLPAYRGRQEACLVVERPVRFDVEGCYGQRLNVAGHSAGYVSVREVDAPADTTFSGGSRVGDLHEPSNALEDDFFVVIGVDWVVEFEDLDDCVCRGNGSCLVEAVPRVSDFAAASAASSRHSSRHRLFA